MSIPIPLRGDFKAYQLRGLAKKTKDGPQARRLLALAAIYDGATRIEAAKIGDVGLQIVRDWVLRFNARPPDNEQRFNHSGQIGQVLDQLLDTRLEPYLPHHPDLETKVAQSTTQIIVDGDGLRLQQLAMGQQHPQFLAA